MDPYKETFETWNKVASLYQDKFMSLDLYDETFDFISNQIDKDNAKILDVGCGPGNITKYFLSSRPEFDIFGIDISPNMIELAKKNNPKGHFAIMDVRQIDKIKTKYNAIVCGFCLPYLSSTDVTKFIKDCYSLLDDNGFLYLSFVEGDPNKSDFQIASNGDRSYFYFHDLEVLKKQLTNKNFQELKIFNVDFKRSESEKIEVHTILIAKKNSSNNFDLCLY